MHFFSPLIGLIVVGGLVSLVAIGDPRHTRLAAYVGFTAFFAGLGAALLSTGFGLVGEMLIRSETVAGVGFLVGYVGGGLGGACFGFYRALRLRRRIETETHEVGAFD